MGSKLDYDELSAFLDEKKVSLKPLIDRTFEFEDSVNAFDYLLSGKFVGKIIIKI
jgi:NADPH:quinone reductase-like Zn-dependent oxidoreductase